MATLFPQQGFSRGYVSDCRTWKKRSPHSRWAAPTVTRGAEVRMTMSAQPGTWNVGVGDHSAVQTQAGRKTEAKGMRNAFRVLAGASLAAVLSTCGGAPSETGRGDAPDPSARPPVERNSTPLQTSAPEAQRVDSEKLEAAYRQAETLQPLLSLLVLRNNVLVGEAYLHGAESDTAYNIKSVSKSILSALIQYLRNQRGWTGQQGAHDLRHGLPGRAHIRAHRPRLFLGPGVQPEAGESGQSPGWSRPGGEAAAHSPFTRERNGLPSWRCPGAGGAAQPGLPGRSIRKGSCG